MHNFLPMNGNLVQICLCSWDSKMDIPSADSFDKPLKEGFLLKWTGKNWFHSGSWKTRYCVLNGSNLYIYEKENSRGNDKNSGVLRLADSALGEYKDKKNAFAFFIATSGKRIFDTRHRFAVGNAEDMMSWTRAIEDAIKKACDGTWQKNGKKREEKSIHLSTPSLDTDSAPVDCLTNATKDRARGPQGRRLPNRKSLMPTSRSGPTDIRQRSISLDDAQNQIEEDYDTFYNMSVRQSILDRISVDGEWLEDMDHIKEEESQRSSSVCNLTTAHQKKNGTTESGQSKVPFKTRAANWMGGQHAAITKELEMKLKAGITPGIRKPPSESEEESPVDEAAEKKMRRLSSQVESNRDTLCALEEKVELLGKRLDTTDEQTSLKMKHMLQQVTDTLEDADRVKDECYRALDEANAAKIEYRLLVEECRATLLRLNNYSETAP